ncbi:MAG: nucleoside triphosphate pyrophosphohydrolase [Hyphomicrobiales bacterium]
MTIHVVGLGPGSPELLTAQARALLEGGLPVLLRTRHHPTVAAIDPEGRFPSCDDLYQGAQSFDEVYEAVVRRVVEAGRGGDLVFAVPGHPLVAERTVSGLRQAARDEEMEVRVYPAVSFVDAAAVALGVDFGGVQLCDALDLRIDAQRPALVSQVFDRDTCTALKLALLEIYPAGHRVTVLRAVGTAEEQVREVPLAELDHQAASYLDCVFVPAIAAIEDVRRFDGLAAIVERLNAPDGCPWDREQTHESLRPHLLEESYEALEAIDAGDRARLTEELGDVLLQVLMHAAVGVREGTFGFGDVTEHIARKLVRRHPHVFGEGSARTAEEVYQNWEALKQQEKPRSSILEGVPATLPALAASQAIQGRARRIGFDWPDIEGPLDKLVEEVQEFAHAASENDREDEFGDVLFVVTNIAQRLGIDAEQALRRANEKFRRRFGRLEALAKEREIDLKQLDLAGLDALWDEAKAIEG